MNGYTANDLIKRITHNDPYADFTADWLADHSFAEVLTEVYREYGDLNYKLLCDLIDRIMTYEPEDLTNPQVFYTGGGIWIAAMYTHKVGHDNIYLTVDCEDPMCITVYDHDEEDQDTDFPCQNMLESYCATDDGIEPFIFQAWQKLYKELQKEQVI